MILELCRSPPGSKYQYYWRRKPDYSTNSPGRAANRLRFTEAAISVRGSKMSGDLPPAALAVADTRNKYLEVGGEVAPLNKNILKELKWEIEGLASSPIQ